VRIVSGGASDVGRVRGNNEDSFRIVESLNLFVLSDGMGGEAHGEVASRIGVDAVVDHIREATENSSAPLLGEPSPTLNANTQRLASAVYFANRRIFDSATEHPEQHGMGATLTTAWINDAMLSVAHVGDSRAYLLRNGTLQQLTNDHSLVAEQVRRGILTPAEAEESELQSVLLRALGARTEVEIDAEDHAIFPRDVLLLCSDGLTRMLTEPEIAGTLQAETNPQSAAEKLIEMANDNGGADNITVIVVRVDADPKGWKTWFRKGARNESNGNGVPGGK